MAYEYYRFLNFHIEKSMIKTQETQFDSSIIFYIKSRVSYHHIN